MKFRAVFSETGTLILVKRFLPCLEKFGKQVTLLLTNDEVHLVQTTVETEGLVVAVSLPKDLVFREYDIKSAYNNHIGLRLEVGLLLRVLRAASGNDSDSLDVKLVKRRPPNSDTFFPYLSFNSKGPNMDMVQDLPVSSPLPRLDVDEVLAHTDPDPCPYFLDLLTVLPRVGAVGERYRSLDSAMELATTQAGSLHLNVSVPAVELGTEFRGLEVFPVNKKVDDDGGGTPATSGGTGTGEGRGGGGGGAGAGAGRASPAERLAAKVRAGLGGSVVVQQKNFLRSLHCTVTDPQRVLCGIAENGGYVQFMFVYKDYSSDGITMTLTLPVMDPGDGG